MKKNTIQVKLINLALAAFCFLVISCASHTHSPKYIKTVVDDYISVHRNELPGEQLTSLVISLQKGGYQNGLLINDIPLGVLYANVREMDSHNDVKWRFGMYDGLAIQIGSTLDGVNLDFIKFDSTLIQKASIVPAIITEGKVIESTFVPGLIEYEPHLEILYDLSTRMKTKRYINNTTTVEHFK